MSWIPSTKSCIFNFISSNPYIISRNETHDYLFPPHPRFLTFLTSFSFSIHQFINCISTSIYFDDSDHPAFSHLTDLEVEKDSKDLRSLTLTFHFSPNEYFNNSTLVKTFKPSPGAPKFPEYEVAEDSENEIVKLDWKNDEKNLCKLNPTKGDPDNEDFEPGSFFSTFFESKASTAVSTRKYVTASIGRSEGMER